MNNNLNINKNVIVMELDNIYYEKLTEHIKYMTNIMYTFNVSKSGGYSEFVTVYKNDNLLTLYSNILNHFSLHEIKGLYFLTKDGLRINVPISTMLVSEFVRDNIICSPPKLFPVYSLEMPLIYQLHMDKE